MNDFNIKLHPMIEQAKSTIIDLGLHVDVIEENFIMIALSEEYQPFMDIIKESDVPDDAIAIGVRLDFPDPHTILAIAVALSQHMKIIAMEPTVVDESGELLCGNEAYEFIKTKGGSKKSTVSKPNPVGKSKKEGLH